jgi:hypothetical protein
VKRPVAALLAAGALAVTATPAVAAPDRLAAKPVQRVLLLTLPGATWADLAEATTPHLDRLVRSSAVASLSVRTIRRHTRAGDGYATIGAGTAAAGVAMVDNLAFSPDEPFEEGTAAEAFFRRTGARPEGAVLGMAAGALAADAARRHRGAEIGALGRALARGGVGRVVVANADTSIRARNLASFHREAALALADPSGVVPGGEVRRSLLRPDPAGAFGLALDPAAVETAFASAWQGRAVVLVEASDLARAHAYLSVSRPAQYRVTVNQALAATDALVGRLLARVDPDNDAVIVLGPSNPGNAVHLGVAALSAPGVRPGLMRSAFTRRSGYVTLPDVAPTVLDLLGLPRPDSMEGRPFELGREGEVPLDSLVRADRESRFRDRLVGPVAISFVVGQILLSLAAALALNRGDGGRGRGLLAGAALGLLAMLPVSYLIRLLPVSEWGVAAYAAVLAAGSVALAAVAYGVGRRWPGHGVLGPLAVVLGVGVGLHVADVVSGSRLQLSTVFGYSPTVGGRFSGFGNLAFAQLAASAALLAGIVAHLVGGRRGAAAGVAVLAVAVVADGMPAWGSDVGGVLSAVPAFSVIAFGLLGWRLSARGVLGLAGATIAALALFGALDLLRAPGTRTHLGRLLERIGQDGLGPLGDAVERKAEANLSVLPQSVWVPLVPAALVFLAYLAWGSSARLAKIRATAPELRPALVGVLVAGALGFAVNDSGIAVPGMILGVVNPVFVYLSLRWT